MRQNNRGQQRTGGAHKHGGGYRGSYYGSDGYDGASLSHRGRGPKGYVRSDARLREIICEYLTDDPSIDASDIVVEVQDQLVRLTGAIEDKQVGREVEAIVESVGGVKAIDNQLRTKAVQPRSLLTLLDCDVTALEGVSAKVEAGAANCEDKSPAPPKR